MIKKIIICLFLFLQVSLVFSQLRYPIVGTYQKKSAQGMAIWDDYAYLFNDGGHCRVLNLKTGDVKREFDLACSGNNTHVNAACFGVESQRKDGMPVIYISEYKTPCRCFVECINDTASIIVQTIQAQEKGKACYVQSWIVDTKEKALYAVARTSPQKGEKNTSKVRINKYRLPLLSEGPEVTLKEQDKLDSFIVEFSSGTQGGIIKNGVMYLPTGLQESERGKFNAKRTLQVISLKKQRLIKSIDLTYVTTNEPEDMDFYHDKALLYCGQQGGIYVINIK